ncbi:hypothetical protein KIJ10_08570 [Leuconostoc gelidum subsp. gasicomitatum]|uniref:hypothetical protein n=1 Tax=Leuconostoc gasicomitatum TaxID=115778 RepID=UPI001CC389D2|nr:hypothetical protein [Leuconostoc gasicomitatum]MBZ5994652.1 hypothetical protein [Leuconostoc gasicomitatum]
MTLEKQTTLIYIGLIASIWLIYFTAICAFSLLFTTYYQSIIIGSVVASVLSLFFISIQRIMNGLNRIK